MLICSYLLEKTVCLVARNWHLIALQVNIVITEEPDPDTETSSEYTDHGFSASNSYTDYSDLSFD